MNDQFDALRNPHRRRLLVALLDQERVDGVVWRRGSTATSDGESRDATAETNGGLRKGDSGVESTEVALYHVHIPRLYEQGFVDYDREMDVVRRGERYDDIRPLLELLDANADRLASWP